MQKADVIDLKKAIVGIGLEVQRLHPKLILDKDIQAVREAHNVLYVMSRILFRIAMRGGVSQETVQRVAAKAKETKWDAQGATIMEAVEVPKETGEITVHDAFYQVDLCLLNPRDRARLNPWFIDSFYPSLLKRSARGETITNRELEIVLLVSAHAMRKY